MLPPLFFALLLAARLPLLAQGATAARVELNNPGRNITYGAGYDPGNTTQEAHNFFLDGYANGQATYYSLFKIMRTGRMGSLLGYNAPDCWLQVGQGAGTVAFDDIGGDFSYGPATAAQAPNGAACIGFNAVRQATFDGAFRCQARGSNNGAAVIWASTTGALSFSTLPNSTMTPTNSTRWVSSADVGSPAAYCRLRINPDGKVQIGRDLTSSSTHYATYKLAVDGKLVAQSVYVLDPVNWPDFVFEPTYQLLPLPELERYLHQHRHLPNVPLAQEVQATGVDLGGMQATLLQQVEELTLRVIELAKQNERLQAEVTKLAAGK